MGAAVDEDLYEDEDDEGMTPGPGAYFNPQQSTTFKVKPVPERMQFFGSTVERFNQNLIKKGNLTVGPGTYTVSTSASQKVRPNNSVPF